MQITNEQKALAHTYADENIKAKLNCSETVFNALIRSGIVDLPEEATAFASGMNGGAGGTGHTCGALAGAVMALSAIYGRKDPIGDRVRMLKDADKSKEITDKTQDYRYYMMRRFNNIPGDFKKEIGTTQCSDILERNGGYWNDARQADCEKCMHTAIDIAIKYMEYEQDEADKLPYAENIFGWE